MLLEWKGKSYNLLLHSTFDLLLGLVAYKEMSRREKIGMFSAGNTTTKKYQLLNSKVSLFYQKSYNHNFCEYLNQGNYLQNPT